MPERADSRTAAQGPSSALVAVFALAAGALVANLYYAQGMATANAAISFFVAAFVIGLCSTGAQVLIPLLAHLVPAESRGRVVGNVMAGLLTGIMLARPLSLFIAASFGWRTVFWCSAALMVIIGLVLAKAMPTHRPTSGLHDGRILGLMAGLWRDFPALRWRAAYQALLFGAFNMFWTAIPLMLAQRFGLHGHAMGLFALAGVGGALAAPVAGRLADRGHGQIATAGAMITLGLAFMATSWAAAALALGVLVVLAIGSILGTVTYFRGGWGTTALIGGLAGALTLLLFAIERRGHRVAATRVP